MIVLCYIVEPTEKSIEVMRKFSEQYARKSGTYFCVDKGVTSVVIKVFISLFISVLMKLFCFFVLFGFNCNV